MLRKTVVLTGFITAAALATVPAHAVDRRSTEASASSPAVSSMAATPSLVEVGSHEIDRHLGLRAFFDRHSEAWSVRWDERSDRPHLVQGRGVRLFEASSRVDLDSVAAAARAFLASESELVRVAVETLVLDHSRSGSAADGLVWLLEFRQHHDGVPVEGATVFVRINHGRVVQFGTQRVADVRAPAGPSLGREEAGSIAAAEVGSGARVRAAELTFQPRLPIGSAAGERYRGRRGEGYEHALVWSVEVRRPRQGEMPAQSYRVRLDATTGDLFDVADLARHAEATVSGGVASIEPGANISGAPFAFTQVDNGNLTVTDALGAYDYVGGASTVRLDGPYVRVDDGCGAITLTDEEDGVIDLGTAPGTDCSDPGFGGLGNTNAARSAFFYLTGMSRKAATFFPGNEWLDATLTAHTNAPGPFSCNAFWDGESVNFFASSAECANTGEIPAVLLHEWAHGLEANTGGLAADVGSSEAFADTVAFLETGEACIGSGFFVDGQSCPNCRTECDGVRDLAAFALGGEGVLARPDTITAADGIDCARYSCPYTVDGFASQGPMGFESHCESYIASTANWDLQQSLQATYGPEEGTARMEDLWYGSAGSAESAYQVVDGGSCNPAAEVDGCAADNWYTVYLAIDDDDGDLANGSPNGCRIWDAFNAHGIACGERPRCSADSNQAPSVTILNPISGEGYDAGQRIALDATAFDPEEGDLSASIEWVSSRDGALGVGASIEVELSIGTHVITATATDLLGASAGDVVGVDLEGELAFVVTKFEDTDDGSCDDDCSLREAINAANANPGPDTVTLPAGEYWVTRSGLGAGAGDLDIDDALELVGAGAGSTIVHADGNNNRVLTVAATGVEISGLTIRGGYTVGLNLFSGATDGLGAGLYVAEGAELVLDRCWVTDNNSTAATPGDFGGGGLYAAPGSIVTIVSSTFTDNLATGLSTLTEQRGGGLYIDRDATVDVVNSTISHNTTDVLPPFFDFSDTSGAYIREGAVVTLIHTTVADNPPTDDGGGLSIVDGATVSLANSIVEGLCNGAAVSLGGNIESPGDSCGLDQTSDRAAMSGDHLALLDLDLGEPTPVRALAGSSLAIDSAADDLCPDLDQLGQARMQDGDGDGVDACDVGAFEVAATQPWVIASIALDDGSLGESSEGSGVGGDTFDGAGRRALRIGDHADGRQAKLIVSFDLSELPEDALVVGATLRLRRGAVSGSDPFVTHGRALVDVSRGGFGGDPVLETTDFEAAALAIASAELVPDAAPDGWAEATLDAAGVEALAERGLVQLRVGFELTQDGDGVEDYVGHYSADFADPANHPELVVRYREQS